MATKKTPQTPATTPPTAKKATRKTTAVKSEAAPSAKRTPAVRKKASVVTTTNEPAEIIVGVAPVAETSLSIMPKAANPAPTETEIAHAAYLNYLSRLQTGTPGDANGDWLDAINRLAA